MKKIVVVHILILLILIAAPLSLSLAHFQMLIPSQVILADSDGRTIHLDLRFMHPFEGEMMDMGRPTAFGVLARGKKTDLLSSLKEKKIKGHRSFTADYTIKRPGDHIFYLSPAPYFEATEESFIVHHTKTLVNAFGLEDGWDAEVGLPAEIIPAVRPYGLWTGSLFQGTVKMDGKAVPFAEIEVEYYNQDGLKAPAPPYSMQVIKADGEGRFSYAMVREGWWGFAALMEAPEKLSREGKAYPVEIGAVMWVPVKDVK